MDETKARRDYVNQATMRIDGEYSSEIPPQRIIVVKYRDSEKKVVWLPGETLPRYARRVCADMRIDVACGDVRYYRWSVNYGPKADRPKSFLRGTPLVFLQWNVGPSAEGLDLATITMEVR
jgi:hypothetical protein